jgi:hypothetical protein
MIKSEDYGVKALKKLITLKSFNNFWENLEGNEQQKILLVLLQSFMDYETELIKYVMGERQSDTN